MGYRIEAQLTFVTVAALGLASCATTMPQIEKPKVELTGVQMSSLSFSGQTFILSFDVTNPNGFSLPVKAVRYDVQLADQNFASGETLGDFSIPAHGDGDFDISVELDLVRSATQLTSILRSGMHEPVTYELTGSLAVALPFVKPMPFSSSGIIDVAGL